VASAILKYRAVGAVIIDDNQLELVAECGEIALDTLLEEVNAVPVEDDRAQRAGRILCPWEVSETR
jgi:hypothetical protein